MIELEPKIDKLNRFSSFLDKMNIKIHPDNKKSPRPVPYIFLSCKDMDYSLSNIFRFSEKSEQLAKQKSNWKVYQSDLKVDFSSTIRRSLKSMLDSASFKLRSIEETNSEYLTQAVSAQLLDLKEKFINFKEFLKEKIFAAISETKSLGLIPFDHKTKKIALKVNLVDKGVQANAPRF